MSIAIAIIRLLLTKEGLYFYRAFCQQDNKFFNSAKEGMICYQIERDFDVEVIEMNINAFEIYLEIFDINNFSNFNTAQDMWEYLASNNEELGIPQTFFILAKEVLEIPSTEAAVERLFTFLSNLTSGHMCNSQEETLSSRLIVKFDTIFRNAGQVQWKNLVCPKIGLKYHQ